ncbi:hypothetical protein [Actinoplanes sp. NPDC023714]|uniref:flavin reductase n=1 Tax=Actinoplanes sp. NPDC023714 TaxID=3154322 RepID=UPI0034036CCB
MTTARSPVPERKAAQGYVHVAGKFAAAGLTAQPSDLVAPDRVAQCPIQLECRVTAAHPIGSCTSFHVQVLRAHVEEDLLVPGTTSIRGAGIRSS